MTKEQDLKQRLEGFEPYSQLKRSGIDEAKLLQDLLERGAIKGYIVLPNLTGDGYEFYIKPGNK